jgi:hypothetical protein
MPVGEIASEFLGGALRLIGNLLLEVVLEFLIRGPGYLLCKPFKKDVDPEGGLAAFVGIVFWVIVAIGAWLIYQEASEAVAVEKCLDSDGAYDRQLQKCVTG